MNLSHLLAVRRFRRVAGVSASRSRGRRYRSRLWGERLEDRRLLTAYFEHEDDGRGIFADAPFESGLAADVALELVIAHGETLSGNRTIVGDVVNLGVLSPGNSPGIITVDGDLTLDASYEDDVIAPPLPAPNPAGTIEIEIGGTTPGPGSFVIDDGYDQIHVTGHVVLGGTLDIVLINDFLPEVGQTFDILTAGSLASDFDGVLGLYGFGDKSSYFAIQVVDNTATPSTEDRIVRLEVKETPGRLEYEVPADSEDEFGEFLSGYFPVTTFGFTGSLSLNATYSFSIGGDDASWEGFVFLRWAFSNFVDLARRGCAFRW